MKGDALSKYLSFILRHDPGSIGLSLDAGGWVDVAALLAASAVSGKPIERAAFLDVVASNDKQRFTLSNDGARVRAAQGHSVPVDLGLLASTPPATLYHGTAKRFLDSILATGLEARSRRHVHLSRDVETALIVGWRHGPPVVLRIETAPLVANNQSFWQSDNGVWLSDPIEPRFFNVIETL